MEIRIVGGSLNNLEILMGGEAQAVLKFQVEVGGGRCVKKQPIIMGVWIFSGITPWAELYMKELSDHAFSPMRQSYAKL